MKLKKASVIKRPIEEKTLEPVTLKKHQFEPNPTDEDEEKGTGVAVSQPLKDVTKNKQKVIESKKKIIKREKQLDKAPEEEKEAPVEVDEEAPAEEPPPVVELPMKAAPEKKELEESTSLKLKKMSVLKRPVEEDTLEPVTPQEHQFEPSPFVEEEDKDTSVTVSHPLKDVTNGKTKVLETKKRIIKKKKKVVIKGIEDEPEVPKNSVEMSGRSNEIVVDAEGPLEEHSEVGNFLTCSMRK